MSTYVYFSEDPLVNYGGNTGQNKAQNRAWLNTESEYGLMEQKHEQAKEGEKYVSNIYEKLAEAVTATEERHAKLAADFAAAKLSDEQEKALLQSLIDTLGKVKSL